MNTKARAAARRLALLLLLLLSAAAHAPAQAEGNPPNWCRNGAFPGDSDHFRLARVKGARGERAYFYNDTPDDCPKPDAKCRDKAYLVPGDEVIVSRAHGEWACSWYQPRRGPERVGWIEAARLDIRAAQPRPLLSRWVGEWEFYRNSLHIRRDARADRLAVEGQAYWQGLGDNVHVGEVAGSVAPAGNTLTLEDDTCRVRLHLVGPYLVADDNGQCGGVNVTFDGVYRKRAVRRRR
ncbi:MAG: hypothetical protein M3416_07705 [Acidobacteriota bacterium]|nr:hypothetical protein [Acidobacteriota bacterium]